jgi:hypothetical protein
MGAYMGPMPWGGRGWQGIIGIVRLWFFKIHGNKNEPPYALIIPKHRGFTTQVLYKNKIAKEFVKASYFFLIVAASKIVSAPQHTFKTWHDSCSRNVNGTQLVPSTENTFFHHRWVAN